MDMMSYLKSSPKLAIQRKKMQFLQTLRLLFVFKVFKETDEEAKRL